MLRGIGRAIKSGVEVAASHSWTRGIDETLRVIEKGRAQKIGKAVGGRTGRIASGFLRNRPLVVGTGIAIGTASALTSKNGTYRQDVYPAISNAAGGDPGYLGMVMRANWNNMWMSPGTSSQQTSRAGGFGPSGRVVLGMHNLKNR